MAPKARKPDAAAFDRAATRLQRLPSQLLLLDDSRANIEAAIACGWHAAHIIGPDNVRTAIETHL